MIYPNTSSVQGFKVTCIHASVTRWIDYFSTFGHLHQRKFAQGHSKYAKVGPNFYQKVKKHSKIAQQFVRTLPKWQKFAKSGHTAYLSYVLCSILIPSLYLSVSSFMFSGYRLSLSDLWYGPFHFSLKFWIPAEKEKNKKGSDKKFKKALFASFEYLFKNGPIPASFSFIFVISNTHYKFYNK